MTTSPGWIPPQDFITTSPGWTPSPDAEELRVKLGHLTLHTEPVHSSPLPLYYLLGTSALDGWLASALDGSDTSAHPSGDGQVPGLAKLEAKQLRLSVLVLAKHSGPASLVAALDALSRLRRTVLVVTERDRGLSRESDVRVTQLLPTRESPTRATVVLNLVADDPVKHAAGTRPLTSGVLANRGDMTAWPIVELVGPHSALTITHPGGTWTLPALGSGVERTIDCRHGVVLDGAGQRVWDAATGSWPRVPAGGAQWSVSGLGSGSARLRRFEAWS